MSPKLDKEWQSQLEAMEKRMAENIENLDKKITENTKELLSSMADNLNKANEKMMSEIKLLMVSEMKEIKKEVGEIRSEINKTESKVQEIESEVQGLGKQIEDLKQVNKESELKYEIKMKELQLRIRGLKEEENEDIREIVVKILAELLEKNHEIIDANLDQVYRLKSRFAEKEGIPRDVIVNITPKKNKGGNSKTEF